MRDLTEPSKPLRVLVITNMYPPQHLGGYELSCQDVVKRWRDNGHRVVVLTSDLHLQDLSRQDEEPDVHRNLRFYWKDHEILHPTWRQSLEIERWNQERLAQALDEIKPDVVSAWNMGAMSLSMLQTIGDRDIPQVFVVCDDWLIHGPIIDAWTNRFRKHRLIGRAVRKAVGVPTLFEPDSYEPLVCFVSETIRRRAIQNGVWTPKRSMVAYTGIERSDFPSRDPDPKAWSWRLLCVGRVEERKGVHVAVEALARLPSAATLTIAGPSDDRYLPTLKRRIDDLGVTDRVSFVNLPRSELPSLYSSSDVFLFPVLWDEPFGLVPVESMACATPVIATGTGGSKEFLFNEVNCLITQPGDVGALSGAIERLAADEELRARIVRAGLTTAEQLGVDDYARVLEDWHRAASERFARGEPEPRTPLEEVLAPLRGSAD